jgi:hypothetical protein
MPFFASKSQGQADRKKRRRNLRWLRAGEVLIYTLILLLMGWLWIIS